MDPVADHLVQVTEHMALDDSDAADDRADVVLPPAGSAADENLEDALAADDCVFPLLVILFLSAHLSVHG